MSRRDPNRKLNFEKTQIRTYQHYFQAAFSQTSEKLNTNALQSINSSISKCPIKFVLIQSKNKPNLKWNCLTCQG